MFSTVNDWSWCLTVLLVAFCHVLSHLVGLLLNLLDITNHVEGHLWKVIVLALHDALEAFDGICNLHILTCSQSEHMRHARQACQCPSDGSTVPYVPQS